LLADWLFYTLPISHNHYKEKNVTFRLKKEWLGKRVSLITKSDEEPLLVMSDSAIKRRKRYQKTG
jgi:hypothetical protein